MTFKKPSSNSSSGDESPKNDDNADGAPLDNTRCDRPTADNIENKRFGRLEALLAAERKKRAKAEQKVATEQMYSRKLRGEIKVNSTGHGIALEKVKTMLAVHKDRSPITARSGGSIRDNPPNGGGRQWPEGTIVRGGWKRGVVAIRYWVDRQSEYHTSHDRVVLRAGHLVDPEASSETSFHKDNTRESNDARVNNGLLW
jgi:hypothetical protein